MQDYRAANIHASSGVAIREFELNAGYGTADYLLSIATSMEPALPATPSPSAKLTTILPNPADALEPPEQPITE